MQIKVNITVEEVTQAVEKMLAEKNLKVKNLQPVMRREGSYDDAQDLFDGYEADLDIPQG